MFDERFSEPLLPVHTYPTQPRQSCSVHQNTNDCMNQDLDNFRIDSQTGECITKGWYFDFGAFYVGEEERAQALCLAVYGASIEEIYEEDDELVYYTEWNEEEDAEDDE